jgi:hypothetical protein
VVTGRRPRPRLLLLAAVALIGGFALGAWIDWRFWNPTYGVQILAVAGALLAIAFAAVLRRRIPALVPVVAAGAIGLATGMALGPSREALRFSEGTVEVQLDRPTAATGTMTANCSTSPSGEHGAISAGDSGDAMRIDAEHELTLVLDSGDMYDFGVDGRPDGLGLLVLVRRIGAVDAGSDPTETRLGSTATSRLEMTGTALAGTLTFDGLVVDRASDAGELVDVAGTVSWSCEAPIARP